MSRRLDAALAARREAAQGAFMPFVVAGDPDPETSFEVLSALAQAGSDVLELGFAFSDPVADGPVIQAADTRALAAGMTPESSFALIERVNLAFDRPMVLLMYYNLVLQYGIDAFYRRAKAAGVEGVLVADLPLEHAGPALEAAHAHDVAPIFIASARSPTSRLQAIAEAGGGFVYTVAQLGVTGARSEVSDTLGPTLSRLRAVTDLPLLPGFGISTPAHVRAVRRLGADGAIVGSALVKHIEAHLDAPARMVDAVGAHAARLAEAAHETTKDTSC